MMTVSGVTRRVPIVEQELLTLLEHMSSPLVFSGVARGCPYNETEQWF
jgi:hypothetical protein